MGVLKGSEFGGLEGMAQKFNDKGLGDIMSSWIGKGENLPISPEQILQVLGSGQVQQIAGKLGVSSEEASSSLAEMLPKIVDQMTPDGSLPSGDLLSQGSGSAQGQVPWKVICAGIGELLFMEYQNGSEHRYLRPP